jgi:beta-N-acetylhexosaminidase
VFEAALTSRRQDARMDVDRLVNACLFPAFSGPTPPSWLEREVGSGLGGVVIYGGNITAAEGRLEGLTLPLRDMRDDLIVAIDEEAGDVTRLWYAEGSRYPGNLALGAIDDVALTEEVAQAVAADLARLGVNYTYAPTVDVNSERENPVIGTRSFGEDPALVARHGAAFVRGLQSRGVAASAKHFPGHGATRVDSHHDVPVIDCSVETLHERELVPFVAAIEAGVKTVMVAHVVFPAFDELPATLSRRITTGLLREELGFDGVVTTDALDMQAVARRYGIPGAAVRALVAGADMLLLGAEDGERLCGEIRALVREAVADGTLPLEQLERSAERVGELAAWARPEAGAGSDTVGLDAARRAVTASGSFPLEAAPFVVELRGETNFAVGAAHWSLAEPLGELGFLAGATALTPSSAELPALPASAPLVVASRDAYRISWQREWIERLRVERPDLVLVGMGLPYDCELAGERFVATYGAARVNAIAAAEVLSGRRI